MCMCVQCVCMCVQCVWRCVHDIYIHCLVPKFHSSTFIALCVTFSYVDMGRCGKVSLAMKLHVL